MAIRKIKTEKNGYYNNLILNNRKNIVEFLEKKAYKQIQYEELKINETIYFYPTNFEIIKEEAYVCLLKILGITNYEDELEIIINPGKLFLQFFKAQEYNLDQIIFGFILNKLNEDEINYELKNILIYNGPEERNNDFDRIVKEKNINELDKDSIIYGLNKQEIGRSYIIDNIIKNEENNIINEDIDYTNAKKYLSYCVILYNEYSKIIDDYNQIDIPGEEINNEYYLINQNYLRELESIIYFNDIKEKIKKKNLKQKPYDSNDEMVEDLFNQLQNDKKMIEELNLIGEKNFKNLDRKDIYEIHKDTKKIKYKSYLYFQNTIYII